MKKETAIQLLQSNIDFTWQFEAHCDEHGNPPSMPCMSIYEIIGEDLGLTKDQSQYIWEELVWSPQNPKKTGEDVYDYMMQVAQ